MQIVVQSFVTYTRHHEVYGGSCSDVTRQQQQHLSTIETSSDYSYSAALKSYKPPNVVYTSDCESNDGLRSSILSQTIVAAPDIDALSAYTDGMTAA